MSLLSLTKFALPACALAVLFLAASPARAQNTAWSAAKNHLPGDTQTVISIDLAALNRTQIWPQLTARVASTSVKGKNTDLFGLKQLLAKGPGDASSIISYVTTAVIASDGQDSALYLSLHGTTTDQFARALVAAHTGSQPAKAAIQLGKLTGYKTSDGKLHYFCFLTNDTLVCLPPFTDRTALQKWIAPTRPPSKLAALFAQVDRSTPLWMTTSETQEIEGGLTSSAQYATINFTDGEISLDLHLLTASAQSAADLATGLNKLTANFKIIAQLQPPLAVLVKELSISPSGSQVIVRDSVAEKDLVPLLDMATAAASR